LSSPDCATNFNGTMNLLFFKLLLFILHRLADLIEAIYYFGLEFRENLRSFIKNINQPRRLYSFNYDILTIESKIKQLEKLPKHLAVLLNADTEKDVDVKNLTDLVLWALNSGVEFISFYDYKGIVKYELSSSFHKTIKQRSTGDEKENIVWGPDFQNPSLGDIKFPHRNGFIKHIVVNLYSSDDGHVKFNQLLTQELCKDNVESAETATPVSEKITVDYIDEKLSKIYGHLPDPDLAMYFGSACCTMGFMPWQIRLTEFIQVSNKLKNLSIEKYLRVLYKFAKCEQRFGK